jgi:hypothetical protein
VVKGDYIIKRWQGQVVVRESFSNWRIAAGSCSSGGF